MIRRGVKHLFENANFNGAFDSREKFQTKISHMAKVDVDEQGTTAVATTGLFFDWESAERVRIFNCNHPFMFLIYNENIKEILFSGIFRAPNQY